MFNALITKAQESLDDTLSDIASKLMVAIPFVVASGFAVAALTVRLHRTYDAETANLILASGFAALGVFLSMAYALQQRRRRVASMVATAGPEVSSAPASEDEKQALLGDADREVVMAALSSAAPLAVPYVLRATMKNLPIIALVAAIGFVLSRDPKAGETGIVPAE